MKTYQTRILHNGTPVTDNWSPPIMAEDEEAVKLATITTMIERAAIISGPAAALAVTFGFIDGRAAVEIREAETTIYANN